MANRKREKRTPNKATDNRLKRKEGVHESFYMLKIQGFDIFLQIERSYL